MMCHTNQMYPDLPYPIQRRIANEWSLDFGSRYCLALMTVIPVTLDAKENFLTCRIADSN